MLRMSPVRPLHCYALEAAGHRMLREIIQIHQFTRVAFVADIHQTGGAHIGVSRRDLACQSVFDISP